MELSSPMCAVQLDQMFLLKAKSSLCSDAYSNADFSSSLEKFSYRLDFRYVSEVYTDFENIKEADKLGIKVNSSYSFINFSADYNLSSNYRIFLTGKNVTDEIYIGSGAF